MTVNIKDEKVTEEDAKKFHEENGIVFHQKKNKELNDLLKKQNKLLDKSMDLIDRQHKFIKMVIDDLEKETYKISLSVFNTYCIPKIIPIEACRLLGLSSPRPLVKFSTAMGLFEKNILALRVPRVKKEQVKFHETTVLFSILGLMMLEDLLFLQKQENIKNMEYVDETEQKEIEAILRTIKYQ